MKRVISTIPLFILSMSLFSQNFGNAISFDGLDDYGKVFHSNTLNPGNTSFSMSCWIQAPDKDQACPLLSKRIPEYPWSQYSYGIGDGDPHVVDPGRKVTVNYIQAAEAKERSGRSTYEVFDGEWHHLAVIANKDVNAIILYLDGIQIAFHPVHFYGNWPNVYNTYDLIVAQSSTGAVLEANVDELILWNKAIDAQMIHTMMAAPLPPSYYSSNEYGVVAYYRFEEMEDLGVGQVGTNDIRDIGPFGNHMDTDGGPYIVPSVPNATVWEADVSRLSFDVFPNPSDGKFEVRCPEFGIGPIEISVINEYGRLVDRLYDGGNINKYKFDVSHLAAGLYFVKIVNANNTAVQKLLIQ